MSWNKALLIVAGCAAGGFIGGVGLASLITAVVGRRVWETVTN